MTGLRAILFDSDGVLVDTERVFFEETRAAFAAAGARVTPSQWARWYLAEAKRSAEVAALCGLQPGVIDSVIRRRDETFARRLAEGVPVLFGVRETLAALAGRVRLAVVTGASRGHFDRAHARTGLASLFEVVVTADDCAEVKPSPQAYLAALERLRLGAHECLAVEDSPRGAKAAHAAGIACAIVPTPLTDLALCPTECRVLGEIRDLAGLVNTWRNEP